MAVEQPNSSIICLVTEDNVAIRVHRNSVASHWYQWESCGFAIVSSFVCFRPLAYLKLVAMKMERMDGCVEVIQNNLNDVAILHHEWIDESIDQRICVLRSCANCCKERWYFLWNVGFVVEICPLSWLAP